MMQRIAIVSLASCLASHPAVALAQDLSPHSSLGTSIDFALAGKGPERESESDVSITGQEPAPNCMEDAQGQNPCPMLPADPEEQEEKEPHRLFPLGGNAAIARGYRIPEPWGLGMLMVWNRTSFNSHDLSAAVAKGSAPAEDAEMLPLPFVTTSRLEGDNRMLGLKGDLWLFPGVNLFASIGKVKGTNRIDIDIDVDAFAPFPFCRPAKPCGTVNLPVETKVNNTTVTVGTILVYGNEHWFVLGTIAKTVSISSKERSDVKSTNIGFRAGPRMEVSKDRYFAPYLGANYFDLNTTVRGVVSSGPAFDDGDAVYLRYKVDMKTKHPYALVTGFNFEFNRHLTLQAELQASQTSTRILASTGVRF